MGKRPRVAPRAGLFVLYLVLTCFVYPCSTVVRIWDPGDGGAVQRSVAVRAAVPRPVQGAGSDGRPPGVLQTAAVCILFLLPTGNLLS